jgi:hypothetical protein
MTRDEVERWPRFVEFMNERGDAERHQMQLDKYARDSREWRNAAAINYSASRALFATDDPFMLFPAVTLGHHALEMYLKCAMIVSGMTVFNPNDISKLDAGIVLKPENCAWGHKLVALAKRLAERNPNFDLEVVLEFPRYVIKEPLTLEEGLEIFDPFFTELRYPQEVKKVNDLGLEHKWLLDALVGELRHARFKWNQE